MDNYSATISIGIPAYNEEANIAKLLKALIKQKFSRIDLKEIIVVSDASTDGTNGVVNSVNDSRIRLIEHEFRHGTAETQNDIVREAQGDILIILNADILPSDDKFIEKIVEPILKNPEVGLVAADSHPIPPTGFFEGILARSHEFKTHMFRHIRDGSNLYACAGVARAFSRNLYNQIKWPSGVPEDAYSYLFCISKGLKFKLAPQAHVVFRVPTTLTDHIKQSRRFSGGRQPIAKLFDPQIIAKEYAIPFQVFSTAFMKYLLQYPIDIVSYLVVMIYIKLFFLKPKYQAQWEVASSTKQINL